MESTLKKIDRPITPNPKPAKWRSPAYLAWVRQQPCIQCDRQATAHHIKGVGHMSGAGLTAPDWATMPLCGECHEIMQRNPLLWDQQWEYIARTLGEAITRGFFKRRG